MKFVVIVDKSDGNDSVGDMWKETYVFYGSMTLDQVAKQLGTDMTGRRKNVTITVPQAETVVDEDDDLPF